MKWKVTPPTNNRLVLQKLNSDSRKSTLTWKKIKDHTNFLSARMLRMIGKAFGLNSFKLFKDVVNNMFR